MRKRVPSIALDRIKTIRQVSEFLSIHEDRALRMLRKPKALGPPRREVAIAIRMDLHNLRTKLVTPGVLSRFCFGNLLRERWHTA